MAGQFTPRAAAIVNNHNEAVGPKSGVGTPVQGGPGSGAAIKALKAQKITKYSTQGHAGGGTPAKRNKNFGPAAMLKVGR